MATQLMPGHREWSMSREDNGHRTYKITHLIKADVKDGPATVLQTAGLPLPGAIWQVDNDADLWAWCTPKAEVKPLIAKEPGRWWEVEQTFTTKPPDKCWVTEIGDPLLIPPQINGGFWNYKHEATVDWLDQPLKNSAHEQLRGAQVEIEDGYPSVEIAMNVAALSMDLLSSMINTVNGLPLWGLPPRTIKLHKISWDRHFTGFCSTYFSIKYEFLIKQDSWDRVLLDEGTKVLNGHWDSLTGGWTLDDIAGSPPDSDNPSHFKRAVDRNNNITHIVLDGEGKPYDPDPGVLHGTGVTPALACNAAPPLILIGKTYGPFTFVNPGDTHFFKIAADDRIYRNIKVTGPEDELEGSDILTFDDACVPSDDEADTVFFGNEMETTATVGTPFMIIGVTSAFLMTYHLKVVGEDMSKPGQIQVALHRPSNFLLLGIPANF